jgi:hypothetical protein
LDEVAEVISLPRFSEKKFAEAEDYRHVSIDPVVLAELRHYVATIASKYHDNPFHNFEHACRKLLTLAEPQSLFARTLCHLTILLVLQSLLDRRHHGHKQAFEAYRGS